MGPVIYHTRSVPVGERERAPVTVWVATEPPERRVVGPPSGTRGQELYSALATSVPGVVQGVPESWRTQQVRSRYQQGHD